jgi:hypothetical protein
MWMLVPTTVSLRRTTGAVLVGASEPSYSAPTKSIDRRPKLGVPWDLCRRRLGHLASPAWSRPWSTAACGPVRPGIYRPARDRFNATAVAARLAPSAAPNKSDELRRFLTRSPIAFAEPTWQADRRTGGRGPLSAGSHDAGLGSHIDASLGCRRRDRTDAGPQVHRSWWVAHAAISKCVRSHQRNFLTLNNGLLVPVGRTYSVAVRSRTAHLHIAQPTRASHLLPPDSSACIRMETWAHVR